MHRACPAVVVNQMYVCDGIYFSLYLVEASVHGSNVHCSDKTIEAAEALLHMESPTCLREARTPGMSIIHMSILEQWFNLHLVSNAEP